MLNGTITIKVSDIKTIQLLNLFKQRVINNIFTIKDLFSGISYDKIILVKNTFEFSDETLLTCSTDDIYKSIELCKLYRKYGPNTIKIFGLKSPTKCTYQEFLEIDEVKELILNYEINKIQDPRTPNPPQHESSSETNNNDSKTTDQIEENLITEEDTTQSIEEYSLTWQEYNPKKEKGNRRRKNPGKNHKWRNNQNQFVEDYDE